MNNPDIADQYVSMVFVLKARICTMAWQDGVVPEKLLKLEILDFMDFSTVYISEGVSRSGSSIGIEEVTDVSLKILGKLGNSALF